MPRKKQIHPSLLGGGPEHGAEWEETVAIGGVNRVEPDDDEGDEEEPRDDVADLREEMRQMRLENEQLRRAIPPAAPVQPPAAAVDPMSEVDWETELFRDPSGTLKRYGEIIEKKVTNKLTTQYQQEQGTQRFWTQFYGANADLKDDHDLVQAMLSANMHVLANMPVNDAIAKLADLTRERILRYSKKSTGRKAVVEGNNPPQPRARPQEPTDKVVTLGDILKSRREARRKGQAA